MTRFEQIKAEIERRMKNNHQDATESGAGAFYEDKDILSFINSLPAEYPSEDLKKEIELWIEKEITGVNPIYTTGAVGCIIENTARHFADWQKEQMMKGFCYETTVYRDEEGDGIDTPIESWLALENNEITNLPNIGLKDGDKVKVIIVKEDEE